VCLTIEQMTSAAHNDVLASVAETCRAGLDLDELRRRLLPPLRRAVAVDALWWAAVDPSTLLFTRAARDGIPAETGPYFVNNEYIDDDVNKWTELARSRPGVRTLWEVTEGRPERSARYREIFEPLGLGDELRAVLRTDGDCWGYLCMHREGPHEFSRQEVRFVERAAPHLADGFRLAMLIGSTEADGDPSPAVVLLDDDRASPAANTAAECWLDELGGSAAPDELPLEVLAVAARLNDVDGTATRSPRLRVRTRAGRWAVLHASWLGEGPGRRVAVVIESAAAREVLPLLMAAHGFTRQERKVTALVCQGLSTNDIGARLQVSTNTVQDHLKSVFTKTGIRSRRELVATLLEQQYR
jgi:DNA-binding CsgD family transcriptional regulator